MNEVEKLLSMTCDFFEQNLVPPVTTELNALVQQGQKPHVFRLLKEYNDSVSILITIARTDELT